MDKLKQIEALATYQGWTKFYTYEDNQGPDLYCGYPPKSFKETAKQEHKYGCQLPNYYDLNVFRELEKSLNLNQLEKYIRWCYIVDHIGCDYYFDNPIVIDDITYYLKVNIEKRIVAMLVALNLWEGNIEEYFLV
jgi:hypothetical protein